MRDYLRILASGSKFSLLGHGGLSVFFNIFVIIILLYALSFPVLFLVNLIRDSRRELVTLELTPPGFIDTPLDAFEKLFVSLGGLGSDLSLKQKLMRAKIKLSIEVVATKEDGLKFIVVIPKAVSGSVKKLLQASVPGVTLAITDAYVPGQLNKVTSFKLKSASHYPLKKIEGTDLPYIASFMGLNNQESISLKIDLLPLSSRFNKKALKNLKTKKTKRGWLVKLMLLLFRLLKHPSDNNKENKLDKPLFKAKMKFIASSDKSEDLASRTRTFKSSLAFLSNPGHQALVVSWLPRKAMILSSEELASIYHFPGLSDVGHELINLTLSRTLAANARRKTVKPDVAIGQNVHNNSSSDIGLSLEERTRHLYVLGGTGNGKTTMLEYMATQDVKNNKGLMVVDPHGDLSESLLKRIPRDRAEDVIYFNPSDIDYPIGLNLLELNRGLSSKDLIIETNRVTESVISVFRKTFDSSEDGNAFRIERLLRYAIHTALTVEEATLFTVSRILSDKYYRWEIVQDLKDPSLKRFWLEEFNKAGDYQRIKMELGPLSRLERYERNLYLKRTIGQTKSGFDFNKIINSKKILICNLSKGLIGEEASSVLGSLLLARLELAVLERQRLEPNKRAPFYLYVDEFQNYASPSFVSMFSEARKYGLNLTMAQQSAAQLKDKDLLNTILDNVGSLVSFRSKSPASEKLILPQFAPYISKGEISNLAKYSFYAKIAATEPRQPISGTTVLLDYPKLDSSKKIIELSRQQHAAQPKAKTTA